jgi:hypothetical protein
MKRKTKEILAFVLNFLLPGLGFFFSGAIHERRWLRLLGIGLTALFVIHLLKPNSFSRYVHLDYVGSSLAVIWAFIFGTLGVGVEQEIDRKWK